MTAFEGITTWYEKNEKKVGLLGILTGFIVDSLTLRGSDQVLENIVLGSYLLIFALGIIISNRIEEKLPIEAKRGRIHFWINFFVSFVIGGLFSAFFVFYFRSASFEVSFPFLMTLLIVMLGNELFKKQTSHMVFQVTIFFFAICSWSIFVVPSAFKSISVWTFFGSSILALLIFFLFLRILRFFVRERYQKNRRKIFVFCGSLFALIHILYFTKLIPPLPLVVKDAGVYQFVFRTTGGNYELTKEKRHFFERFRITQNIHLASDKSVYVFSAVYSPADLNTSIMHSWQQFDEIKKEWIERSNISVPLIGGRTKGYRLYTLFPVVTPGLWRVDVKTRNGQIMKRIKFNVVYTASEPELVTEIK